MLRFHRILVPIDFSKRSNAAVSHAIRLAAHFNADTIFVHAIPSMPYSAGIGPGMTEAIAWDAGPEVQEAVEKRLEALLQELAPGNKGDRIVLPGDPGSVIRDVAKERQADLIVMPTAGAGFFRRLLIGSATAKVLHDSECPVFTGAHVEDVDAFSEEPFRKVGCALDLESGGEHVLGFARDFASAYDAKLYAIHVAPHFLEDGGGASAVTGLTSEVRDQARARVQGLIQHCGAQAEVVIESGDPEEGVARAAEEQDLDLIVVGRRSSDGLLSGLRAHAYGIIRRAPCPVLSI